QIESNDAVLGGDDGVDYGAAQPGVVPAPVGENHGDALGISAGVDGAVRDLDTPLWQRRADTVDIFNALADAVLVDLKAGALGGNLVRWRDPGGPFSVELDDGLGLETVGGSAAE